MGDDLMRWQDYLAKMDHSKGTSNAMIQKAMQKEIFALRAALRKQTASTQRNKEASKQWRAAATRYQALAAKR